MLKLTLITALLFTSQLPVEAETSDLIILNGKIFTSDQQHLWAQAIAIKKDRIVAVGTNGEVLSTADGKTQRIDAGERVIVPGFNDAHVHEGPFLPSYRLTLPSRDPSWDDVIAAVSKEKDHQPKTDILRGTIGRTAFIDGRATRDSLDRAAPGRAVFLQTSTSHGAVISSEYMHRIGLRDEDLNAVVRQHPPNATANVWAGRLTEYLVFVALRKEAVTALSTELLKAPGEFARMGSSILERGVTSIQDMGFAGAARATRVISDSKFPVRVREIFFPFSTLACEDDPEIRTEPAPASNKLFISGCKWILDGTPAEFTAALSQPYPEAPMEKGVLSFSDEQVDSMIQVAESQHQQLLFHAIGDRAIEQVLHALERHPDIDWPSRRVRIEHGDGIRADQIGRLQRLGVIVVINPTHLRRPIPDVLAETMKARFNRPIRTLLAAHVPLAIGADAAPDPFTEVMIASNNPFKPEESITREQAVIAHTYGSSFAEFQEKDKGRLAPGQLADVVVLSQDIFTVPADQIPKTRSLLTLIGGEVAFDAHVLALKH